LSFLVVLVNLLELFVLVARRVFCYVVDGLYDTVPDGLPERVAIGDITEILIVDVARPGETDDVPEAEVWCDEEFLPLLQTDVAFR
jgi:hypothetical protein